MVDSDWNGRFGGWKGKKRAVRFGGQRGLTRTQTGDFGLQCRYLALRCSVATRKSRLFKKGSGGTATTCEEWRFGVAPARFSTASAVGASALSSPSGGKANRACSVRGLAAPFVADSPPGFGRGVKKATPSSHSHHRFGGGENGCPVAARHAHFGFGCRAQRSSVSTDGGGELLEACSSERVGTRRRNKRQP